MAGANLKNAHVIRALDSNGASLSGAKLYVYEQGTTTAVTTYSDLAITTANAHPVVADSAGSWGGIYLLPGTYKIDVTNSAGTSLDGYPVDDVLVYSSTPNSTTPFVVVISGQSNAAGSNSGGANLQDTSIKIWDGGLGAPDWGGSSYTDTPLSRAAPDGNSSNNNIALAFADRVRVELGRPVYIIIDTESATIGNWVDAAPGTRYTALKTKVDAALASTELAAVTKVDCIIWVHGEADFTETQATHLTDLQTLVTQFRAESWCDDTIPILMHGLSDLHERREPVKAIRELSRIDPFVTYVNSRGLATSDNTHFTGADLYRTGYYTTWRAYDLTPNPWQIPNYPFRSRINSAVGEEWTYADDTMILPSGAGIIMGGATETNASPGSIASGGSVDVDGNNNIAFGDTITILSGTIGAACFGFQLTPTITADRSLTCGRGADGNTIPYSFEGGTFPAKDNTTDIFRIGYGTSTGNRLNAIAVEKDTGHLSMVASVTMPGATLTLASDIITATHSFHLVAGQSGAADDIVTINGGVAGQRLVLRPSSDSVTITVVDTGNIVLAGAADFVMDSQDDIIELIYDAARSKWLELSRSGNGT